MSKEDMFANDEADLVSSANIVIDREEVRGALDELFSLARRYRNSAKFQDLLKFVASFHRYSAFNAMLVHIQMPGAKYVLPAKRWGEYGRTPTVDAQPLIMLQPMSPIMFGFDVAQTEGRNLPPGFEDPFETRGCLNVGMLSLLTENSHRDGIDVKSRSLGSTLGGYIRNAADPAHVKGVGLVKSGEQHITIENKKVPLFASITLNSNVSDETNFSTLTHELGHLYCGHVGTPNSKWWPDRRGLTLATQEFEAESVSYLVCSRAGISTPAVEYLHHYLGSNPEVPAISLDVVFKATQRIEAMSRKKIPVRSVSVEPLNS